MTQTIGYLRVSTADQDTDKNEAAILKYANMHNFGKVSFVSEKVSGLTSWKNRELSHVVEILQDGDKLIVPELSRLGRSLADVLDVLSMLSDKHVKVYSVKENFQLNGDDMQSKMMRVMLGLFAEIENDLRSARTKEGLAAARAKGQRLGRPRGPGKSKLDKHKAEITDSLKAGVMKKYIAQEYGVTPATLWNWLKRHKLDNVKPPE